MQVALSDQVSLLASVVDGAAPINLDVQYTATRFDGGTLPSGVRINSSGLLTVDPGSLPAGTHRIALTASNLAGRSAPRMLELQVAPPPPQAIESAWMASHGLTGPLLDAPNNDGDTYSLVTEYALGLDPTRADGSAHSMSSSDGETIAIEWNALPSGARYTVEHSGNLHDWSPAALAGSPLEIGAAGEFHRRMRAKVERSGAAGFYRVKAELTEAVQP
jgi:hypothetical protein